MPEGFGAAAASQALGQAFYYSTMKLFAALFTLLATDVHI